MILGKSLFGASAHLQQNLTEQLCTGMSKYMLEGLENYQIAYHHHCSENSQLKTWRVLKECQDELGCIDLAVWILLIHRYTEFCSLLGVFYH